MASRPSMNSETQAHQKVDVRSKRARRVPTDWPRKKLRLTDEVHAIKRILRSHGLLTVCEDARCPNLSECFSKRETTFMILGQTCTRACSFCAIPTGRGAPVDEGEPERLAEAARVIGLRHVVVTSVARDDLPDEGAGHFRRVVDAIRKASPETTVEVLVPDFHARLDCLETVAASDLVVFNHNLETIERLQPRVRPQAAYRRSLSTLARFKELRPEVATKSGIMLGLGEDESEIAQVLRDMRSVGVTIVTIGQYMQPQLRNGDVVRYATAAEFGRLAELARDLGFKAVQSGPYVRSSYKAASAWRAVREALTEP